MCTFSLFRGVRADVVCAPPRSVFFFFFFENFVSYNLSIVCYDLNMCPQGMSTVRRTG